jgi:membrane protein
VTQATRNLVQVFYTAFRRWRSDLGTFQFGAAIAYFAVFAITPLAVITVAIAGWLFGEEAAAGELASTLETAVGPILARAIQETIARTQKSGGAGVMATLLGLAVMFVGAIGVFTQLQQALNFIWSVRFKTDRSIWTKVRDSILPFLMILSGGALLVAALLASTLLSYLEERLGVGALPGGFTVWHALDWFATLALLTLHFAMVYKALPAVRIAWRVVWLGAAVTALLFTLGNYVIGLYLAYTATGSSYGAAGSLVMILVWVYFSSQLVLFGAELTRAYADYLGKPITPSANAVAAEAALGSK